ncbi:MAG: hypothetical protein AAFY41_08845, partial [Bacteroidota bacterium]
GVMELFLLTHIETIAGLIGIIIAIRAFILQKREVMKNGQIATLTHASNLLQNKIDHSEAIIQGWKSIGNNEWRSMADKVNRELRPTKNKIDVELLNLLDDDQLKIDIEKVKELVKGRIL